MNREGLTLLPQRSCPAGSPPPSQWGLPWSHAHLKDSWARRDLHPWKWPGPRLAGMPICGRKMSGPLTPFLHGWTQTSLATRTKSLDPFSITQLWAGGHLLGDSGSLLSGWTLRALGQAYHGPRLLPGTGHWARRRRK